MKINHLASAALAAATTATAAPSLASARELDDATNALPDINSLINIAYPMWAVGEGGNRKQINACTVESCEWNPFYITKRYGGLHPDLGGHPTDNDVRYTHSMYHHHSMANPIQVHLTTALRMHLMISRLETAPRLRLYPILILKGQGMFLHPLD